MVYNMSLQYGSEKIFVLVKNLKMCLFRLALATRVHMYISINQTNIVTAITTLVSF